VTFKSEAYYSRIYQDFKEITGDSHDSVIRFFESHQGDIEYLALPEQFELSCEYAEALFQDGQHEKHLKIADWIIETSIYHNYIEYRGKDIYSYTLLLKAASLYYLEKFNEAIPILQSLRKIDPEDSRFKLLYFKVLCRKRPPYIQPIRNFFLASALAAAFLIALELLWVRTNMTEWANAFEMTRNIVFCLGTILWVSIETRHQIASYRKAYISPPN
jgi:hypothetical protein